MGKKALAVELGEFVARLRFEDLPPAVVDKAKAVVNHAVTVAMAGFGAGRTEAARRAVLAHERVGPGRVGAGQGATLWVDGARVTRAGAAFANGVAIAVNNQCDSYHMLTHPGVLIVPAGVGTAEGEGRTGRELLTALAAGYEVQCRCARDFIPSTPARGFRASPVYGILGCAATTAKLLGLDAARTASAIALAASFAGSLIEGQRTGARDADFAEAQAARSGMWAAALAAAGFGRTAYMLANTVVTGDYPVLERNVEDPRDAGASADADVAARVSALQRRVEILGVVGRECFAPRLTFVLRDGPGVTGEYEGRELMWDFARDARELRRIPPGLPILPARYDELVAAIAGLDASASVDAVLRLTLATKGEQPA